jgi:prolyl oligopeptidase
VPFKTGKPEVVAVPAGASVYDVSAHPSAEGALVKIASWTTPQQILALDARTLEVEDTRLLPPSPVVFTGVVAEEVKAKSEDGTMVPLSIIRRADLPLDGGNPTWLIGYASYGFAEEPSFEPTHLAWLERGGVVAYCHARGGGEYGEEWHEAGKLKTKPNSIADFVACARQLVERKITSPAHLAGQGWSAGGIVAGGAITAHPELFGAAILRGGMLNALRFEQIPIGPFNTSEFGTVKTEEGFRMLSAIDAFHHVADGGAYPAVLVTTGIKDPRVSPWQSAKMAARLQAKSASGKPALLRVSFDDGHGNGSSRSQEQEELADTFAFLLWQIGKK